MFDPAVLPAPPMTDGPPRKRFSIEEAKRSLVYLAPVARDVAEAYAAVVRLPVAVDAGGGEALRPDTGAYRAAMDRLAGLLDELSAAGVELRDFERGRLAFPAERDAEDWDEDDSYHTWHLGAPAVEAAAFHRLAPGLTERPACRGLAA